MSINSTSEHLIIGTKVTVPTGKQVRKTVTTGPLRREIPVKHAWVSSPLGWPAEEVYTVTGMAVLRDITWTIDEVGETIQSVVQTQLVYRVRRTLLGREIFLTPDLVKVLEAPAES